MRNTEMMWIVRWMLDMVICTWAFGAALVIAVAPLWAIGYWMHKRGY